MGSRWRGIHLTSAGLACAAALALVVAGGPAAAAPGAPAAPAYKLAPASQPRPLPAGERAAGERAACPAATRPGLAECSAVLLTGGRQAATIPGFGPVSLRSAYALARASATAGATSTVAIVAAYGDSRVQADLATYRSHFHLSACGESNGCLRIINEQGAAQPLPGGHSDWAAGQSLALDVVSALCPRCRLLLVQASSNSLTDLGTAEDAAVAAGAKFVLNGWGSLQSADDNSFARYFNHPGVAIVFGGTDAGYKVSFPAALPDVTAVGGTTLKRSKFNTRKWAETAWFGTDSGCAAIEAKPSWQRADAAAGTGCLNRTENDVAADADPMTGAASYDTFGKATGWTQAGGSTLAAAIVTAAYALAGKPASGTYPASYPYQHARHLFDVRFGLDGVCGARLYLCQAGPGYDGPTGLGTPDGTAAFSAAGTDPVTLVDPGTQDALAGTRVTIKITGLDARRATGLSYAATGLPAGLSVSSLPHSTNAEITGKLPAAATSYPVTLTGTDTVTGAAGSTSFSLVATGSLTPVSPITSAIRNGGGVSLNPPEGQCLDSGAGTAGTVVTIQTCTGIAGQLWTYLPEGAPGAPDELTINGLCLRPAGGSGVQLATCDRRDSAQSWRLLFGGTLEDVGTGTCLSSAAFADPLTMRSCDVTMEDQQWHLLAGTLQSAVPGMCAAVQDDGFHSAPYTLEPCGAPGFNQEAFGINNDGSVLSSLGRCMAGGSTVQSGNCDGSPDQVWLTGPDGELLNGTGQCLDDPGDSQVAGTQLVLQDCYGQLGEIWAIG